MVELLNEVKLQPATPYMLRNDGTLFTCDDVHPYIMYSHQSEGDALSEIIKSQRSLQWFYNSTNDPFLREAIEVLVNSVDQISNEDYDIDEDTYKTHNLDETYEFINEISILSSQEFLRLRMSAPLYGGTSKSLYARISSVHFDWYPLLWDVVNDNDISDVTVIKDSNTFGGRFIPYKVKGQSIDHISKDEFITLSGNPTLEMYRSGLDIIDYANRLLYEGKSYRKAYYELRPRYAKGYYDSDIYEGGLAFDINNVLASRKLKLEV